MKSEGKAPDYLGHRQRLRERFLKSGIGSFTNHEVVDASFDELRLVKGIDEVAPVALCIVREMTNLYLQRSAEYSFSPAEPESLISFWCSKLGALSHEVFQVAYFDSAYRLLQDWVETPEEGTAGGAAVYPRRVIEAALRRNASALVFGHNHPNGNVQPSEQDKVLKRALLLAAATVAIKVVDHVIVAGDATFSFRKEDLL